MTSSMLSSRCLEDLRPMSQAITIIPRSRSASHSSSRDTQRRNSLKCDSDSSLQSVADESLSLVDIEGMLLQKVKDKKDDLKAAFRAFDHEGSATVTKGEFRRVIEGFLVPLTQSQFDGLLLKIPKRGNGTIPYNEFLQQYCKISTSPIRNSSSYRTPSGGGDQCSCSLGELQCRLKDKIGGNLKNVTRAFRLFDYNRDGQIQQHELRRVLESYCFPLSHHEFRRLWSHYSRNNSQTISYKEFLQRLGVVCENHGKIAPDSVKLALNWDASNQCKAKPRSRTSAWETASVTQYSFDEIYTMFLKKMSVNCAVVEKALQALDIMDSGIVSYDDLKSVLSSFLFPIDHNSFLGLLNRLKINPAEPVQWRKFIALFRNEEQVIPVKNDTGSAACKSSIEEVLPKLREQILEVFPHLKRAFLVFDENRTGLVSRSDLRRLLESLSFTLTDEQFRGLTDLLHFPHSGSIIYQHVLDFFQKERPAVVVQEQISESTEKPELQTQPTALTPSNTAAWTIVEGILKEQLSEHYSSLMSSLSKADPTQTCTILPKDLRKLFQQYGLALSDSHFNKLCEPFTESGAVNYKLLLISLGISMRNGKIKKESAFQGVKKQAVVDVVLKKLRDRLQMRGITLHQCLMDSSRSSASLLDLRDFRKILDDCRISLQVPQYQALIQTLGFFNGQMSFSDFIDKYEGAIAKEKNEEHQTLSNNIKVDSFMTAEDCLYQLEEQIKECHRDVFTAFRLMDRNRDGLVNHNDFRVLFNSLRFVTKEKEYQRLLELLGFKPGSTINYAEFYNKICSDRKTGANLLTSIKPSQVTSMTGDQLLDRAYEQVHAYLAAIAHTEGSELSKVFTQYGEDSESKITKNDLRHILYKYYLPITPREFEKIWARYDDDGKGYITQIEFLNKLNITPHESTQSLSTRPSTRTSYKTVSQSLHTETELDGLKQCLKLSIEDVRQSLVELDANGDGYVTATDLLALLRTHGIQLENRQLLSLINNLGLDVCKVSYHDFLDRIAGPRVSSRSIVASPLSESMMSSVTGDNIENLSPERALQKVKELVTNSLDTLSKAFSAFDKTRNGKIAQAEFRRVLDHFCIKLSDVQYRYLLAKLSIKEEESKVDWKEFLHIFNLHKQETSEEWLEKIHKVQFPNQTRLLPVSDILGRIKEVVAARIYTITKEMVDLDYAGINMITKDDFRTICDHHFMRLTDEQFEALWKLLPVSTLGHLDYREFLKKFSKLPIKQESNRGSPSPNPSASSLISVQQCPKTAPCRLGRSKSLRPEQLRPSSAGYGQSTLLKPEAMERRLRSQIRSCWQEIQRRCREADTASNGEIDVETFLGILEDLQITVTHSLLEQLSDKYKIRSKACLSYPEFLQHFVLTLKPQMNTFSRRHKLHLPSTMSSGLLSKECQDTLLRLCPTVQLNWRTMKQAFISCDKRRTGKISFQDFRKILRQYNVSLSEEEIFHLTSFFDKDMSGHFSYHQFLSILQK